MRLLPATAALLLASCAGSQQSAVDAAGAPGAGFERLWWFFFWLLLAIFVIVIATLGGTLARRRSASDVEMLEREHSPTPGVEARTQSIVTGAITITVVILMALIVVSVVVGKSISNPGRHNEDLAIQITGNQWWWDVRYLNDDASQIVVTANEIHIPVGKRVMIRGESHDVIHSFWAPNLQGKRDLIPSRITTEWIEADRPGRFRGQCAEFCGLQHAHMAFWVVAEPQDKFDAWMRRQLQPSAPPTDPDLIRGQQVFLNSACVLCHNITGTTASGQVGPDLTHLASRLTIAAGTLPNTKGNLAGWITDPQRIKPGNHMATVPIKSEDLQPLIDYLESLQ